VTEPLRLTPLPVRYRLAGPATRRRVLDELAALLAALAGPLQVWHGGSPAPTLLYGEALADAAAPLANPLPAGAPGPDWPQVAVERPGGLELADGRVARALVVSGWPAQVSGGWPARLAELPGVAAVALHAVPVAAPDAARMVRRLLTSLLAAGAAEEAAGTLPDARAQAAAETASRLAAGLARGSTALLRAQLLVGLVAGDQAALAAAAAALDRTLAAQLATARLLRFEQEPGWAALRPGGAALTTPWRVLDAAALAAAVPLPVTAAVGAALSADSGLTVGRDVDTGEPVRLDRFALANPARLVLGASGAGKSFAAKLEVQRWLARGDAAVVVDPEGEFGPALAGAGRAALVLRLGSDGDGLDPVGTACAGDLAAGEALALLASVTGALLGQPLDAAELGLLDAALSRLRAADTPAGPGELLAALTRLAAAAPWTGNPLPARLAPAMAGTLGSLLAANPALAEPPPLVVVDGRDVPEAVRPAVTAAALGWAWTRLRHRRRTLVVVDEAHLLLADPAAAALLGQLARRARKYGLALELLSQQVSDLTGCPAGQAVLANAASALLLGCGPTEQAAAAAVFGLAPAETALLGPGRPGRGLLIAGAAHLPVQVEAEAGELTAAAQGPRP
jgi:hypothetical protein